MKILVTGAGGNVGSGLVTELEDRHELRLSDIQPIDTAHEFVRADVRDRGALVAATKGVDLIVHTPAWHGIHLQSRSEEEFWDLNVLGTFNAFHAAVENDVPRMVWLSSQSVFSRQNIYGMTKVVGEDLCRFFHDVHGVRCIILRPADFTPFSSRKHYGERLLRDGVDRRDVMRAVALAVDRDDIDFQALPVLRKDPFTERDVEDWSSDPGAVLERYLPGARDIVDRYALDLPKEITRPDVTTTAQSLGYAPQNNFLTFLHELAGRDAAGDAHVWLDEL